MTPFSCLSPFRLVVQSSIRPYPFSLAGKLRLEFPFIDSSATTFCPYPVFGGEMFRKQLMVTGGLYCGFAITAASICQQWGLKYISAGKTGFLTALYIVIVPVIGIFFKRKTATALRMAVFLALGGSYLLCGSINDIGPGEILVITCAVLYSFHILIVDHYAPYCDCVRLSCIQFIVASIFSFIFSLLA